MITPQLLDYISNQIRRGVPDHLIRQQLAASEWLETDVDEALRHVRGSGITPHPEGGGPLPLVAGIGCLIAFAALIVFWVVTSYYSASLTADNLNSEYQRAAREAFVSRYYDVRNTLTNYYETHNRYPDSLNEVGIDLTVRDPKKMPGMTITYEYDPLEEGSDFQLCAATEKFERVCSDRNTDLEELFPQ